MSVKLLTEHHLEFLDLKGGCTGSSESTLVKMPHCWKSDVTAQMINLNIVRNQRVNKIASVGMCCYCIPPYISVSPSLF